MDIIDTMIFKGDSVPVIAAKIQQEWEEITDVKFNTLKQQLLRYKKDMVAKAEARRLTGHNPNKGARGDKLKVVIEDFVQAYDTESKLRALCAMQETRLNKMYALETGMPQTLETVRREIDTFNRLLQSLTNVQMDLGILQRIPKRLQADVRILSTSGQVQKDILTADGKVYDAKFDAAHEVFKLLEDLESSGELVDE